MAEKEDFLETLLRRQAARNVSACTVGRFLASDDVPAHVREGVERALETPRIVAGTIGDALTEYGFECSEKPVWRHRGKKCSCFKGGS